MKRTLISITAIAALSAAARAAPDCSSFLDDTARLACYDQIAKGKKPKTATVIAPTALTPQMIDLRGRLDKAFLEASLNIDVIAVPMNDPQHLTTGKKPTLLLFGYLNRASVYQIITKTDLVHSAREVGYRSIDVYSKGSDGRWIFDLTGPGQTCARDLCF
jgi:hypothetical protein